MRFELIVATRYLRAKRRQAVVGVITVISIIGVTAGVASLVIALAVNNGFRQDLQDRLLGSTSHVNVMRVKTDGIARWPELLTRLEKQPGVIAGAPVIYEQVLVSRNARASGVLLKGVIPEYERKVSDLLSKVKFGSAEKLAPQAPPPGCDASEGPDENCPAEMPPIVLGKDVAANLGATVGSIVLVTSPQSELTPFGVIPKFVRFKVEGIFDSGFYENDSAWGFVRLGDAQRLFGLGDVISVLEFKIKDIDQAQAVGRELEQAAGQGFMATNWMDQNRALFHALRLERVVTFVIIGLIVLVAALNILISLIMMVMEKTKDIAVLISMGAKRMQVRRIFILQGVLIGLVGTILGLLTGYGVSLAGAKYHPISLSAEVYSIPYVPFAPRALDGLLVATVALGVSFVATIYPSWSASRVLPAEALRYE